MNSKKAKRLRREVYGAGAKREIPVEYVSDGHKLVAVGKRAEYLRRKDNCRVTACG